MDVEIQGRVITKIRKARVIINFPLVRYEHIHITGARSRPSRTGSYLSVRVPSHHDSIFPKDNWVMKIPLIGLATMSRARKSHRSSLARAQTIHDGQDVSSSILKALCSDSPTACLNSVIVWGPLSLDLAEDLRPMHRTREHPLTDCHS